MTTVLLVGLFLFLETVPPSQGIRLKQNETVYDLKSIKHAKVDLATITVSGVSSGAFMSIALHYMYSSKIQGAGSFAGGPFAILYNVSDRDNLRKYVSQIPSLIVPLFSKDLTVDFLQKQAISLAEKGLIDPIKNLRGSKSYIFQGGLDPWNIPFLFRASDKASEMYKFFDSDLKYIFRPDATHCVPTDYFGPYNCPILNRPADGVNNCNYQGIYDMFSHLYGSAYVPAPKIPVSVLFKIPEYKGKSYTFSQIPYQTTDSGTSTFMNADGGIYIPPKCANPGATCKLHLALHGCGMSFYSNLFDDLFAKATGYLQVADTNNVIMLFPRASAAELTIQIDGPSFNILGNAKCWDFCGLTSYTPALKDLPQVQALSAILNDVIGHTVFTQKKSVMAYKPVQNLLPSSDGYFWPIK